MATRGQQTTPDSPKPQHSYLRVVLSLWVLRIQITPRQDVYCCLRGTALEAGVQNTEQTERSLPLTCGGVTYMTLACDATSQAKGSLKHTQTKSLPRGVSARGVSDPAESSSTLGAPRASPKVEGTLNVFEAVKVF